jgi:phage tail-like protein
MPLPENDSSVGHSFGLEFDGIQIKSITEVSGLKMEQDVIEYKSNTASDGKYVVKKLPGRWKAGECTLTRALTDDSSFDKWVKDSQLGKMDGARKGGAIVVYDFEGNAVKRYKITNAWPKSLEVTSLKAGDTSVLSEKLVLTYEKCEPESA